MFSLPCEGVDLFGELAQENVLGGVSEHQHYVHVSRPQLHQIAHVSDIRQLRHLHKILLGGPTKINSNKKQLKNVMINPNILIYKLYMYSCLEVPPVPGDPFSAFVPSFAFGVDCLSSLESLHKKKVFPKGEGKAWKSEIKFFFLWLVFSFL